jgi:hypothetical protein
MYVLDTVYVLLFPDKIPVYESIVCLVWVPLLGPLILTTRTQ